MLIETLYEIKHGYIDRQDIARSSREVMLLCITELIDVTLEEHPESQDYMLHDLESYIAAKMYELKISAQQDNKQLENVIKKQQDTIDGLMIEKFNLSNDIMDKKELIENVNGKLYDQMYELDNLKDQIAEKNELIVQLYSRLDK